MKAQHAMVTTTFLVPSRVTSTHAPQVAAVS